MKVSSVEWLMEIDKSRLITIEEWQKAYDNYNSKQYYNEKFGGNNDNTLRRRANYNRRAAAITSKFTAPR